MEEEDEEAPKEHQHFPAARQVSHPFCDMLQILCIHVIPNNLSVFQVNEAMDEENGEAPKTHHHIPSPRQASRPFSLYSGG